MTTADALGPGDTRSSALLLPALSSVATRDEMGPLASRLQGSLRCRALDWPGFGAPTSGRLSPAVLNGFLDATIEAEGSGGRIVGIAAGHGATYLARAARRHPGRFSRLVVIAPTWRGPLPTMTRGGRPDLCRRVRTALEMPGIGPLLFRLNLSRGVVGWMMREHVYADAANVTPTVLDDKLAVARRPGARLATAAFVSGGLDPVASREAFLQVFERDLPPVLMLRPRAAPPRSAAEMDALAAAGHVETVQVEGALAAHEECPDEIAGAILSRLPAS